MINRGAKSGRGRIEWVAPIVVASICLQLLASGCTPPKAAVPSVPARPQTVATPTAPAIPTGTPAPAPAPTTTALDYLALADRTGPVFTPTRGSTLRKRLMNAARKHMRTKRVFVVHELTTGGEVTEGVIEPEGTGQVYRVTWVLWKRAWNVVICNAVGDGLPQTSSPGGRTSKTGPPLKAFDAGAAAERALAAARAAWDVYNAKYQAEYQARLSNLNALLAERGMSSGSNADAARAKIPAQMAADGWPAPGPRP